MAPWRNIASKHNMRSVKIFGPDIIFQFLYFAPTQHGVWRQSSMSQPLEGLELGVGMDGQTHRFPLCSTGLRPPKKDTLWYN